MKKTLGLFLILISVNTFANERVKVFWDCDLDAVKVDCNSLEQTYFENSQIQNASSVATADLQMIIRGLELNNEIEFSVITRWQGTMLPYPKYRLNSSFSPNEISDKLLSFLDKITKVYTSIANSSSTEPEVEEKPEPYFINPYAEGFASKQQGSSNSNSNLGTTANYSTQEWRLFGNTNLGLSQTSVDRTDFSPGMNSKITTFGSHIGVVRSVKDMTASNKGQWNVAIFVNDRTVKNDLTIDGEGEPLPEEALKNTSRKTVLRVGTEWIAVPFLTDTSKGNFAVRYSLGGEHHKYLNPETYEYVQETFARHLVQVYLAKHYEKIDIAGSLGGFSSSFRSKPLQGVTGSLSVNYKVTPRLNLGVGGSIMYTKNAVLSTAEGGTTSFSGLTGLNAPLTYSGNLGLSYTLGSIKIKNKERRWQ